MDSNRVEWQVKRDILPCAIKLWYVSEYSVAPYHFDSYGYELTDQYPVLAMAFYSPLYAASSLLYTTIKGKISGVDEDDLRLAGDQDLKDCFMNEFNSPYFFILSLFNNGVGQWLQLGEWCFYRREEAETRITELKAKRALEGEK